MNNTICTILTVEAYRDDLIRATEKELGERLSQGWKIESTVTKTANSFYVILSKQVEDSPYR